MTQHGASYLWLGSDGNIEMSTNDPSRAVRPGYEFQTLAEIEGIFVTHPNVQRIQVERRAPQRYIITVMDDQRPNDLKKISELHPSLDYERNNKRGWERISSYHVPTDTVKFVFYRLGFE